MCCKSVFRSLITYLEAIIDDKKYDIVKDSIDKHYNTWTMIFFLFSNNINIEMTVTFFHRIILIQFMFLGENYVLIILIIFSCNVICYLSIGAVTYLTRNWNKFIFNWYNITLLAMCCYGKISWFCFAKSFNGTDIINFHFGTDGSSLFFRFWYLFIAYWTGT